MNIRDLKKNIIDGTVKSSFLIFECPTDFFLANQYIAEISNKLGIQINYVSSPIVGNYISTLNIYTVDTFEEDIAPTDNLIIRCKKSNVKELDQYVITCPELENWQIENYATHNLPGLSTEKVKWLCNNTKHNMYALENEISKLRIFDKNSINIIFDELNDSNAYDHLSSYSVFDFINALLTRNKDLSLEISKYIDNKDVMLLILNLENNLRNILLIKTMPHISYYDLGLTNKQYYYIKNNLINYFSEEELINHLRFVADLDFKIKDGIISAEEVIGTLLVTILGEC